MRNKIFRNLDEQINILKNKNLIIEDEEQTKQILLKENYFFISGYRHLLMKNYKDKNFISDRDFIYNNKSFKLELIKSDSINQMLVLEMKSDQVISCLFNPKYSSLINKDLLNSDVISLIQDFAIAVFKTQISDHDTSDSVLKYLK